ncbi:uncharacterized protein LOC106013998 [Aplysia californica]|uniref:Uncharacterized protein LOC106013998 n=1 Tax=Aplysia californica TaxID=6500 RepID=A0ABM1AF16_APLCA|nr:uncharacterized protein LOC106013998 [Aplysia californica]
MFAKLKKKIETDGGAVGAESPGRSGGGLSRHSSVSSLPGAGMIPRLRDGPSPPGSVTSEDFSMRDPSANREDVMLLLQKKTEQCRKLEGNISDLAALIKDKSKTIEKLEANLKQQDEVTNQKLQDQKAEFEKYRDKLIQGYQEEKIKLDKENQDLQKQLSAADEYRAKYFKKEEETEEFAGLTTQELAKVKHLVLHDNSFSRLLHGELFCLWWLVVPCVHEP